MFDDNSKICEQATKNIWKRQYYRHQPVLTGALLAHDAEPPHVAYIGFLEWQRRPRAGGSQFKSLPAMMIKIVAAESKVHAALIDRIDSQFEYEWEKAIRSQKSITPMLMIRLNPSSWMV